MPEDFNSWRPGTYTDAYKTASTWDGSFDRPARSNQNYVYASWWRRVGGALIDYIAPWALLFWLPARHGITIGVVGFLIWIFVNSLLIQSSGGQSIGKMVFGIQLVHVTEVGERKEEYCQIPTFGRVVWRLIAHLVDTAFMFYGWFRPLTNVHHRTYADSMAKTIVVRQGMVELMGARYLTDEPQQPRRSWWQ